MTSSWYSDDWDYHQGNDTSGGSGARGYWNEDPASYLGEWQDMPDPGYEETDQLNEDLDLEETYATGDVFGKGELTHGQIMNAKTPPAFDGRMSFFAYENLVYDWCDFCQIEEDRRGPALKQRLTGDAAI